MRVSPAAVAALCCGLLLLGACDSAPGPAAYDDRPPVVSDLSFTPANVVATQVPPGQSAGEQVRVPLQFSVRVDDPDRDLALIGFAVQSPLAERAPLAEGTIDASGTGTYAHEVEVMIPKSEVGVYTLRVFAVDRAQNLSNEVLGTIRFFAEGSAPVVESVEAFPEIIRPPTEFILIATVSDPDGLANIASVRVRFPTGAVAEMYDDGRSRGDEVAGDGRYTARFDVPQATPGVQTFQIWAIDRTGLESAVFEKPIRIE